MKVYELQQILADKPSGLDVKIYANAWNGDEIIKSSLSDLTSADIEEETGNVLSFQAGPLDFDPSELATPVD